MQWIILFTMLSLKCEQPYVKYLPYFQQWNLIGHDFAQFTHRFKIGIFWVLVLGCTSKFFPVHKQILGFLNVALSGLLYFFQNEKNEKLTFFNMSLGYASQFFLFHKRIGILGFLKSPWFYNLLDCEYSLSGTICL